MANMNITIPGASKNTGKFVSKDLAAGKYEFAITSAEWDTSKQETDEKLTLVVKCTVIEGPNDENGKSPAGRKNTIFLSYRYGDKFEDWMRDGDVTMIVQLTNALGLKVVKDKIPVADFAGKNFIDDLSYSEPKEGKKAFAQHKFSAVEE
jgi:hypothetical protein